MPHQYDVHHLHHLFSLRHDIDLGTATNALAEALDQLESLILVLAEGKFPDDHVRVNTAWAAERLCEEARELCSYVQEKTGTRRDLTDEE